MTTLPFRDRVQAGAELAASLMHLRGTRPLVLAIPRGAVPMARHVADVLDGQLDVIFVKKLGAPGNPELAIGSIDEEGTIELNENARWLGVEPSYVHAEGARVLAAIQGRRRRYRDTATAIPFEGQTVIVIDDGLATGSTMAAALRAVRRQRPTHLVCAVPVASRDALALVQPLADETVCLAMPSPFGAVGQYYADFSEVQDADAIAALAAPADPATIHGAVPRAATLGLAVGSVLLEADLFVPARARGLVVFAHGSGSSRTSPRNQSVARVLNARGFATLLFDLLTPRENQKPAARFDIPLLASRLGEVIEWAGTQRDLAALPIGLFGASTGAAAALLAAAASPSRVGAVVSRGGRPDMAGPQVLAKVHSPTLFIVGGDDHPTLELNRLARDAMEAPVELAVVPKATHLFEEPGALDAVATLSSDFFARELAGKPAAGP